MKKAAALFLFVSVGGVLMAQNALSDKVYTILNTKCSNGSCHSATSTDAPKFDGIKADVLSGLLNLTPANSAAQTEKDKVVRPGHPYQSFLLNKIGHALNDSYLELYPNGGAPMNDINGNALSKAEVEYVRQWIMFGCQTGTGQHDQTVISTVDDYYSNDIYPFLPTPPAPPAGEGLQVRCGPYFLPKTGTFQEQEWLLMNEVDFPYLPEVTGIEGIMNQQSHHFLLFKFNDSTAAHQRAPGMALVSILGGTTSFDGNKDLTGAWQDDAEINLPEGTALYWDQKTYLDLNYHIKNYANDGALPADFYLNILFRPRQASTIEMKSALVNNAALVLFQGNNERFYDDPSNGRDETRHIWMISSHTHKYGTDFDIHERNPTAPNQLGFKFYEGFYNYEQNYDRGYYDWEHPSIRYFPHPHPVDMKKGIRVKTDFNVAQPLITFGFTSNDEMQLYYYMYSLQDPYPNAVHDLAASVKSSVHPNPSSGSATFVYELTKPSKVKANLTDLTGRVLAGLSESKEAEGIHQIEIDAERWGLSNGIYFIRLEVDGHAQSTKLMINR